MTEAITYLLGIGVTAIIFGIVLYNMREEEVPFLRFFLIMLMLTMTLLVSKTLWDARTECDTVVANATILSNVSTGYEYTTYCFTTSTSTPGTFQTIIMWSFYIIIGFVILWLIIKAVTAMLETRVR